MEYLRRLWIKHDPHRSVDVGGETTRFENEDDYQSESQGNFPLVLGQGRGESFVKDCRRLKSAKGSLCTPSDTRVKCFLCMLQAVSPYPSLRPHTGDVLFAACSGGGEGAWRKLGQDRRVGCVTCLIVSHQAEASQHDRIWKGKNISSRRVEVMTWIMRRYHS